MHWTLPTLLTAQQLLRASPNQSPAPTTAPLFIRQNQFVCPAGETSCLDGSGGCCSFGVACTSSHGIPVCDEACGIGPTCSGFGCCKLGYTCDYTSTLCVSSTFGFGSASGNTGVSVSVTSSVVASSTGVSKTSNAAASSTIRSKSTPSTSPTSNAAPTATVGTLVEPSSSSSTSSNGLSSASSQGQSTSAPTKSALNSNAVPTSTVPQSSTPATVTVSANGQEKMGLGMSMFLISCGLVFFVMLQ